MVTRLCLLALLALWAAIAWRVATDSSNHVGWSPLWALPLPATAAVFSVLVWSRTRDSAAGATVVLAAVSIVGLYLPNCPDSRDGDQPLKRARCAPA